MFKCPCHCNQVAAVSWTNEPDNPTHVYYFCPGKLISSRTRYALRFWLSKYVRTSISANSPISKLITPTRNVNAVSSGNGVKIIDTPFANFKYNTIAPDMNEIASVNNPNPPTTAEASDRSNTSGAPGGLIGGPRFLTTVRRDELRRKLAEVEAKLKSQVKRERR